MKDISLNGETVLRHHEGGALGEEYDQAGAAPLDLLVLQKDKLDPLKLAFESLPDYSFFHGPDGGDKQG